MIVDYFHAFLQKLLKDLRQCFAVHCIIFCHFAVVGIIIIAVWIGVIIRGTFCLNSRIFTSYSYLCIIGILFCQSLVQFVSSRIFAVLTSFKILRRRMKYLTNVVITFPFSNAYTNCKKLVVFMVCLTIVMLTYTVLIILCRKNCVITKNPLVIF